MNPGVRRWGLSGYPLVFASIVVSYAFTAAQSSPLPSTIALAAQLVTVAAVLHAAGAAKKAQRLCIVILGVALLAIIGSLLLGPFGEVILFGLAFGATGAYGFAVGVIFLSEARRRLIDARTLFAVICAYLLIGMFFTYLYSAIALTGGSIFGDTQPEHLADLLFFSFTTLTTTGYGNLVPAAAGPQSVAIAEAITGQLFLVTAVARVVTGWNPKPR